jgi:hypothetical protein
MPGNRSLRHVSISVFSAKVSPTFHERDHGRPKSRQTVKVTKRQTLVPSGAWKISHAYQIPDCTGSMPLYIMSAA